MRRLVRVLTVALVCSERAFAAAASGDPIQAPECQRALTALHSAEQSASTLLARRSARAASTSTGGSAGALDPRLAAARRDVARRCLEAREDPPRPGRLAAPPMVVPPVAGAGVPRPPATPPTTMPARVPTGQPPVAITSCDVGGCWTSEGTRLQRLGPTLLGPHGACSVVGAVVQCP
ncbi:MAG: hypothetical protein JO090_04630 [Rhizobacter sp.]|nr:hypothetical protein [Rhizobacter sp.]